MGTPEGHGVKEDGVPPAAVAPAAVQQEHGALGCLSADEELQQAVCGALIEQGDLDSTRIEVRAAQGIVVLTGSVRSREDWMQALRIARRQAGARSVQTDQLAIRDA
jgi:osmotically-inducible protein OsmY